MTALAPQERDELAEYEAAVERGLSTFLDVGRALLAIRDGRLYRADHDTFESYCERRWGMTKTHANRMVQAAEVADVLTPVGVTPANEAQARELAPLLDQPERLRETWQQAQEQTAGKPTAAAIRSIVRPEPARVTHTTTEKTAEEFIADRDTGEVLSVEEWQAQEAEQDWNAQRANTDARFVVNLFRAITTCNAGLLDLDAQRAVETCRDLPDERDSLLAFLDRLQGWADHVRSGLRPNLRSIR